MAKKITITLDRVEFNERSRERFKKRLIRYRGLFQAEGGSTHRQVDLRLVPEDDPCVVALGATGNWSVTLDVEGKTSASVRFTLQSIGLDRALQPAGVTLRLTEPYKEKPESKETTADYTLYWSMVPDKTPTKRKPRTVIRGSRQNLKSKKATPVLVPRKPKLRAVLFAPATSKGTSMYSATNKAVRDDLGLSENLPVDGPYERLEHLFNVLSKADKKLRASPYKEEEKQAGEVVRVFVAPEWYFRRDRRPYTQNEMITVIEGVKKRSATKAFKRWLIIPGSIYWGLPLEWKTVQTGKQMRKRVARHSKDVKNLEKKIAQKENSIRKLQAKAVKEKKTQKVRTLEGRITSERGDKIKLEAELRRLQAQNPYGVGEVTDEEIKLEMKIKRLDDESRRISTKETDEKSPKKKKKLTAQRRKKEKQKTDLEEKLKLLQSKGRYKGAVHYKCWRVFNTAPIIFNGRLIHMYSKRFEADIEDGKKKGGSEVWGMSDEAVPEHAREQVAGTGVFQHAGLKFGLEICRDHTKGRLIKQSLVSRGVDVHVVIANDVNAYRHFYAARGKGCFFMCDASGNKRRGKRIKRAKSLVKSRPDYQRYFQKTIELDKALKAFVDNKDKKKKNQLLATFNRIKKERNVLMTPVTTGMTEDDLTDSSVGNTTIYKLTDWC